MAENAPAAPAAEERSKKKKCAQTGVPLKRVRRYFRDGQYFANKGAYRLWKQKKLAEKPAAKEEAAAQPAQAPAEQSAPEKQA